MFGHKFYIATEECEKIKCIVCEEWFDTDKAIGRWIN